jgi:hypothetical protein
LKKELNEKLKLPFFFQNFLIRTKKIFERNASVHVFLPETKQKTRFAFFFENKEEGSHFYEI